MNAKDLISLRKEAEKAVADMPDGEMKVKAFEVVLSHLLSGDGGAQSARSVRTPKASAKVKAKAAQSGGADVNSKSLYGRILVLKDEGFFKNQKTLTEVREELKAHGWHYPITTMSGPMQRLTQQRELRRERVAGGKKKVWTYSNP